MKEITVDQAFERAARVCSKSEKSPRDASEMCRRWGLDSEQAEKVVVRLISEKFISEERFAHAFVHDKYNYEHWGKSKIVFNLRTKGIPETIIQNTIDDVIPADNYVDVLKDLLRSKLRGMTLPLDRNAKAKLFRFAAQRGFDYSTFSKAIAAIGVELDDDDGAADW